MIQLFLVAASAATSVPAQPARAIQARPAVSPDGPARGVIEAQLRAPPRQDNRRSLSAEEADTIYKRYIASIGQPPQRAPQNGGGSGP